MPRRTEERGRSTKRGMPAAPRADRQRLDVALIAHYPDLSRRRSQAAIEKGQVTVNGIMVREPGHAVTGTDRIAWDPHRPALRRARLALPRLFEDQHLLIVDKPAGMLSVPTHDADPGREETALGHVREYASHLFPQRPFVGRVHRLDRDTSGALMFALSPAARARLIDLVSAHHVERRYLAVVVRGPRDERGTIDAPIRSTYRGGRRGVAQAGEPSEPARTHYEVRERWQGASLLEVRLDTGRQHQIRAHLAHLGFPVLGDRVYGTGQPWPVEPPRIMLHAWQLRFTHPITNELVEVEAPWPDDLRETISWLRRNLMQAHNVRMSDGQPRDRRTRRPRRS
jgi:23S rRNA pseudouridine1911/1915/1917 synthase